MKELDEGRFLQVESGTCDKEFHEASFPCPPPPNLIVHPHLLEKVHLSSNPLLLLWLTLLIAF